jgi:hypothetical protein
MRSKSPKKENLKVGDYDFEAVDRFRCLESLIANRNRISEEIQCRTTAATKSYYGLQKQLKSKQLKGKIKLTIYKTIIGPVLLYGSDKNKLRIFKNQVLRIIYGPVYDGY